MQHNIAEAGGLAGWEDFPLVNGNCMRLLHISVFVSIWEKIGLRLLPQRWHYVSLFIWGGCCMHKEMNSVKGGNAWMMAWWSENNLEGLMKLYNWDNSSAATLGGDAARE